MGWNEWLLAIQDSNSRHGELIWRLRLPRAMAAWVVGAMLAMSGCLMQVLLRNPLADPYVLGVSGGAAFATLMGMVAGIAVAFLPWLALLGALVSILIVFGLARGTGPWSGTRLLLTGVVTASGWAALISLILSLSPDNSLRGMLFWLMGDLSFAYSPARSLWLLAAITIGSTLVARHLNVLARGELQAAIVGMSVATLRMIIFAVTALATAVSVTTVGVIGFIGLVVPHLIRLVVGSDHRIVLPASALAGGSLLVIADTLARTVMAPRQLPVGALTAALGVPLFLILMSRSRRAG